jgi:hypothetical protein
VAKSEHEQCVRENFSELAANQHVSRKGVAKGRIALALRDSGDELGCMALDLLQVLSAERFPLGRGQAGDEPIRGPELEGEGAVGEVEGSVLAGIQDRACAAEIVTDHRCPRAR